MRSGMASWVLPFKRRPVFDFWTPPHCLKKKATASFRQILRMFSTHLFSMGRAPSPLSPPTIAQSIPEMSNRPRSSSSGSRERNRTAAGAARRSAIRGNPYFRSSTLTPHQMCRASAAKRSFVESCCCKRSDPLGENLIGVPVGLDHHPDNILDIGVGNSGLEQIAHAVDKYLALTRPCERLRQFLGHQAQIEPLPIRMARHAPKALGEGLGIAMLAAGADFRASAQRVPSRIRPLDFGVIAHGQVPAEG